MVRDEQEGDPADRIAASRARQPADSSAVQLGGRLVENDEPAPKDSARAISTVCCCSTVNLRAS